MHRPGQRFRSRRVERAWWLGTFAIGLLLGVIAGGYVLDRSAPPPEPSLGPETYIVQEGRLGRTLRLPATGAWPVVDTIYSPAAGTVTEVVHASGMMSAGNVVLRVDERPVILLGSDVPSFRDLAPGDRGRDVAALQGYLAGLGLRVDASPDRYTETTAEAAMEWQRGLGITETGVVARGDVLFVPTVALSSPLRWTETVRVGSTLSVGMPLLHVLGLAPHLWVEFGNSPPAQLVEGLQGEAVFGGGQRLPVVLGPFESLQGRQTATLNSLEGSACADEECLQLVLPAGETPIAVEFTLVPETVGPVVPVAAIQSDASGRAFVEMPDGSRRPVTVRVSEGGAAIVEGVSKGETILIP